MRRAIRRFGGRGRRRSVAWIPGYSTNSVIAPVSSAFAQALALVPGSANTYGFGFALVNQTDLSLHGGEDAVIVRILGRLSFFRCLTAGAAGVTGNFGVTISMEDTTAGQQAVREWIDSDAYGRDDVMFHDNGWVDGNDWLAGANFSSAVNMRSTIEFDIKAKRKIQQDRQPFLNWQLVTPLVPTTVSVAGHLRMLLMRPR